MITVCILTKDNEKSLKRTLTSVISFPEVIVLDNGSTDATLEIASHFPNVKVCTASFNGFGPLKNKAASLAKYDWILSLDSDEVLSDPLVSEIHSLDLDGKKLYRFCFHNFFNEKWIKGCGWYPDKHIRLYNKRLTSFSNHFVHEKIDESGFKIESLRHPIFHYSYQTVSDFLVKMDRYSTLFAEQNKGKKSSFGKAIFHSMYAFIKSYILQRGFLDGKEGYLISLYNAQTCFYKYIKLCFSK